MYVVCGWVGGGGGVVQCVLVVGSMCGVCVWMCNLKVCVGVGGGGGNVWMNT